MKTDAEKKLKPKRPRKVIKKSHMEDSYPTYLQVLCFLFDILTPYMLFTNRRAYQNGDIMPLKGICYLVC